MWAIKKPQCIKKLLKLIPKASHRQHTVEEGQAGPTAEIGAQSPANDSDQEMEDATQKDPKKSQPVFELSDEDDNLAPRPKTSKRRKQSKKKKMVIDSNDSSSDDQVTTKKKPKVNLAASLQVDMDIEEIPNPKESAEDELGEC